MMASSSKGSPTLEEVILACASKRAKMTADQKTEWTAVESLMGMSPSVGTETYRQAVESIGKRQLTSLDRIYMAKMCSDRILQSDKALLDSLTELVVQSVFADGCISVTRAIGIILMVTELVIESMCRGDGVRVSHVTDWCTNLFNGNLTTYDKDASDISESLHQWMISGGGMKIILSEAAQQQELPVQNIQWNLQLPQDYKPFQIIHRLTKAMKPSTVTVSAAVADKPATDENASGSAKQPASTLVIRPPKKPAAVVALPSSGLATAPPNTKSLLKRSLLQTGVTGVAGLATPNTSGATAKAPVLKSLLPSSSQVSSQSQNSSTSAKQPASTPVIRPPKRSAADSVQSKPNVRTHIVQPSSLDGVAVSKKPATINSQSQLQKPARPSLIRSMLQTGVAGSATLSASRAPVKAPLVESFLSSILQFELPNTRSLISQPAPSGAAAAVPSASKKPATITLQSQIQKPSTAVALPPSGLATSTPITAASLKAAVTGLAIPSASVAAVKDPILRSLLSSSSQAFSQAGLLCQCGISKASNTFKQQTVARCPRPSCFKIWCRIGNCTQEFQSATLCLAHQESTHGGMNRRLRQTSVNFNIMTNATCNCSGIAVPVFKSEGPAAQCRICKATTCLVPNCVTTFPTMNLFFSHYATAHLKYNDVSPSLLPSICGICGTPRHSTGSKTSYAQCQVCNTYWCTMRMCQREFSDLQALLNHQQRNHKQ